MDSSRKLTARDAIHAATIRTITTYQRPMSGKELFHQTKDEIPSLAGSEQQRQDSFEVQLNRLAHKPGSGIITLQGLGYWAESLGPLSLDHLRKSRKWPPPVKLRRTSPQRLEWETRLALTDHDGSLPLSVLIEKLAARGVEITPAYYVDGNQVINNNMLAVLRRWLAVVGCFQVSEEGNVTWVPAQPQAPQPSPSAQATPHLHP